MVTDRPVALADRLGPSFRHLWGNSVAFALIASADRFAFTWLVSETLGRSDRLTGFVVFCLGLPIFLIVLPAGALADRGNRRLQLFASQIAGAIVTAAAAVLLWTDRMNVGLAIVAALAFGTAFAFAQPVRSALIQSVVPRHLLLKAIPIMTIGANLAMIVGPVVVGVVIRRFGIAAAFAGQSALFVVSMAFLSRIEIPPAEPKPRRNLRADIAEGVRYAWGHPVLRTLFFLMAVGGALMQGPSFLLVPRIASAEFGRDADAAGALFGMMGLGMMITSFVLLGLRTRIARRGRLFALCLLFASVGEFALGFVPSYGAFAVLMGLWGLIGGIWANMNQALIQESAEPAVVGRVMALTALIKTGLAPIAALVAGTIAEAIGPQTTLGAFGAAALVCTVLILLAGRRLWHLK